MNKIFSDLSIQEIIQIFFPLIILIVLFIGSFSVVYRESKILHVIFYIACGLVIAGFVFISDWNKEDKVKKNEIQK